MRTPTLLWDIGTAYDMFISLDVLHNPDKFGLRGAWAAASPSIVALANGMQDGVLELPVRPV